MNKKIFGGLCILYVILSIPFWFGERSVFKVLKLHEDITQQQAEVTKLRVRNQNMQEQIEALKVSPEALEEFARYELGMIKQGETYYQIVDPLE